MKKTMNNTLSKKMMLFMVALFSISTCFAGFEVVLPGISAHFGPGIENAPRKIDDTGIFVFNPGIGGNYDFREVANTTGFSLLVSGVFFKDCQNRNMFSLGAGARGRLRSESSNTCPSHFRH